MGAAKYFQNGLAELVEIWHRVMYIEVFKFYNSTMSLRQFECQKFLLCKSDRLNNLFDW
jgi:hypothetical protein